jgi:hypothetical protein
MSALLRGAIAGAALLTLSAGTAHAAPALLSTGSPLIDASADGRYVLIGQNVLDRTTGATLPVGTGTPLDLASHAPRVLVDTGAKLVVRDLAAGTEVQVNLLPTGEPVGYARAELAKNGNAVFFGTTETTPRIIVRNRSTNSNTVRAEGVTFQHVSEDGDVVTWSKQLPEARRPANLATPSGGRASLPVTAVGYVAAGGRKHVVATSQWTETLGPDFLETGDCTQRNAELVGEVPTDLRVSQDEGASVLWLTKRAFSAGDQFLQGHTLIQRVTTTGVETLRDGVIPPTQEALFTDPETGSYALVETTKASAPRSNVAQLVAQDGTLRPLGVEPIAGPGGTFDTTAFYGKVVPINGGAGAIYQATPSTRDASLARPAVYVNEGEAPGASAATHKLILPREVDAELSSATTGAVAWAACTPNTTVGTIDDYTAFEAPNPSTPNGKVVLFGSPDGLLTARSVKVTVSWYGLPVWTRSATAETGVVFLPQVPKGLAGFKVTSQVTLTNGTKLSTSWALRRK